MSKKEVIKEAKIESVNKNDKLIGIIVIVSMILVLVVLGTYFNMNKHNIEITKTDAIKFKEEYEQYNDKKINDLTDKKHETLDISRNNIIEYANYNKVFSLLENETAVIYFGTPTCPWCRNLVPVLLDAAKEAGIDKIYYLNNEDSRDEKKLDGKKIKVEKEGTKDYYKLIEKLDKFLGEYKGLKDKKIKRLYFPTVVFVKDGKVEDIHIGTIPEKDEEFSSLTDKEKKNLKEILIDKMSNLLTCTGAC